MDFSQFTQPCRDFWLLVVAIAAAFAIIQNFHLKQLHQSERNELQKHKEKLQSLEQRLTLLSTKREPPYAAWHAGSLRRVRSAGCSQECRGPRGFTGTKGVRGHPGIKGSRGQPGEQGIRGFPGEDGQRGPAGFNGNKGDKGDKGDRGRRGLKGEQGRNVDKLMPYAHVIGRDIGFGHKGENKLSDHWDHKKSIRRNISFLGKHTNISHLVIKTSGVYFVYAQLKLLTLASSGGLHYKLMVNDNVTIAESTNGAIARTGSNFVGVLHNMTVGHNVSVRLSEDALIRYNESFFGAFLVSCEGNC